MPLSFSTSTRPRLPRAGFTLMEILVVIAIILVLAAIAFPVFTTIQMRQHKAVALNNIKQLTAAAGAYAGQNNGELPNEDSKGVDTWQTAADPQNGKTWYNALPKLLGQKTVGDFATTPREFYTKENILFLPGAVYPESDKKLVAPLFAIAINTKLQRTNDQGIKDPARLSQISNPVRTVLFLEQGINGEKKLPIQPKFDGSCKGSAKSFVGRYGDQGHLGFADGHVEAVAPKDVLTETGKFPFPQTSIIWTRTAEENPNK
jgi:prepilin-type N-terminal cleavage/methylation domain-containing protein/prepilin-type processing-associated H-X9-DG protein